MKEPWLAINRLKFFADIFSAKQCKFTVHTYIYYSNLQNMLNIHGLLFVPFNKRSEMSQIERKDLYHMLFIFDLVATLVSKTKSKYIIRETSLISNINNLGRMKIIVGNNQDFFWLGQNGKTKLRPRSLLRRWTQLHFNEICKHQKQEWNLPKKHKSLISNINYLGC